MMPILRIDWKEGSGSYRLVSLASMPGLYTWQGYGTDYLECDHMAHTGRGDQAETCGFRIDRSCLTNLIFFYNQVTHLVGDGRAVDAVYLYFIKAFDTVSKSILLEKLVIHGLDRCALHWVKNWLDGQAQGGLVYGVISV